ncbi:MAG: cation-translocating P-type ATPase [Actinomycetota bacterium]|nr:cation-translocating P-type ATPase [Actinomycetota bacterium]
MSTQPPETFVRPERAEQDGTAKLQLKVGGMHCSLCTESIHKGLSRLDGVEDAQVSIAHEEALIRYDPTRISDYEIKETLEDLGYTARDPDTAEIFAEEERELAAARRKAMLSGVLLAAASALMAAMLLLGENVLLAAAMGALALFLFFGPARFIVFRNGFQSVKRGILNQDVLVSAASIGGLIGGFVGLFVPAFPAGGFFGATVFVLAFHLIGGYASVLVHVRASQSVRRLLELEPPTARRVEENGSEAEVSLEELAVGDLVRVRPGERVPVDGVVEEGTSAVDESLVTGESIPQDKLEGDEVIGGSLNQAGAFVMRVTRVGDDTFLRNVARQVAEARALKPGILRLVDRVLLVFVPAVFSAAALGFLLWTVGGWIWAGEPDFLRAGFAALGVLVMGYPCALGMATPLAIIRGSGEAADRGFLMRSGEAFHVFKDVKKIVLDKTGTITHGEPAVAGVVALDGFEEAEALSLAAAAEASSEHPLARAVVGAAGERDIEIPVARDFEVVPGKGVRAEVEGRAVAVGSPRFVEGEGADLAQVREEIETLQAAGNTVVVLAVDGRAAALVSLADRIKEDAKETVERLKAAGLEPVMLTGDNERTARAMARQVGIAEYRAEVLPEDKARVVRELQEEGFRVAMVGDGINDAPALMQSDLGVAIGAGTDVAVDAADVVITGDRLSTLVEARELAGRSYRLTFTNVVLALLFNGAGVLAAISGLVAPVWAMLAMAASVSLVLANSFAGRLLPK